jgi:hypothetical protein
MKTIRFLIIPMLALSVLSISAEAQRKKTPVRRTTTTASKSTTTAKPAVTSSAILAKNQVSTQLFNVNRFVDVLGPIAQGIETTDSEAKTKKPTKAVLDLNLANKQKVVQSIRNLKTALSNLETDFRTKIELRKYLPTIQGITDLCSQSEDSAIAGKFVAAKEPLRAISKKLSDTLALMP